MTKQFHETLTAHYQRLRVYAIKLTRNLHEAEDLLQTTAVLALRAESQFTVGTNFSGWVHRIMKNSFLSSCRTIHRRPISIDDAAPEYLMTHEAPDAHIMLNEATRAIAKLPPDTRRLLTMIYQDDFTYEDASAALSCSVGTVKSRLWRGRVLLRKLLGETSEGPAFLPPAAFCAAATTPRPMYC